MKDRNRTPETVKDSPVERYDGSVLGITGERM